MNQQQNVQLVQQAFAAFSTADIDRVLKTLAADVDWFIPGPTEIIPFAGKRHGPQEVAESFCALAAAQVAERFEPLEFIASEPKVVMLGVHAGA
ncbi:nuclear transport factor 2 family protein [Caballeronia grimmiae]|uniref:nuclear transport factor 2 family protein n=1 Tax=Caballeronia grimmiae TaxID=1071679 RepID=UPI0038BCD8C3